MSSSSVVGNDEFVPGRKLLVHVAENGHSFEFECDGSTLVEMVQQLIQSLSGVQVNDQLLLCLDKKLESSKPLSFYKLPHDDSEVFLYNRPRLHADSSPPDTETIDMPNVIEPDPPSPSKSTHAFDDAPDPALMALPSYERQFRYHFQRGQSIHRTTQAKFGTCQRLLKEQWVQQRALETARGSMDQGYRVVQQNFNDFIRCYLQQHRYHSEILANLGKDIEKLRLCELHPALKTESRKCLLDLVKEDSLRKWAENCANSHRQFEIKVSQLKSMFGELKGRVEDLRSDKASAAVKDLDLTIKGHQKYLDEQKSIMQSLSKDINTVKKHVDDCLSCQLSDSLRPHDAVSALGPMYHVHEKSHLPKIQCCDHSVTKLFDLCKIKKNEMNLFVHHFMQKVVYAQSIIRDIRLQFPVFKEAMERQDDYFSDLRVVRGIAPAYRACFAEIIRRRSSMKLYMGFAGQLAERLATEREREVRKREEFLKAQSVYVPQDILASMGLFDNPKQCDISIAPFDANLLEIDIPDLDRYAPKFLVGLPPNWEKNSVSKDGSIAISEDSCGFAEAEMNSVVSNVKCDSIEILESCDSVHIAGTSKLEVENAWLKAELASEIVLYCSIIPEIGYESMDDGKLENLLKSTAEKTAEALHLKDKYNKHIQSMLKMKDMQCSAYEKRIQELEQRLAETYMQGLKVSNDKETSESAASALKTGFWKSDNSGDGEAHIPYLSSDPMDEASCTSAVQETKLDQFTASLNKPREGVDESMTDLSGTLNTPTDYTQNSMDSSMLETQKEQQQNFEKNKEENMISGFGITHHEVTEGGGECMSLPMLGHAKVRDNVVSELKNALSNKSNECDERESKLQTAMDEIHSLKKDLEVSRKLLDESLMNCAHLENCLHEAREKAHTNLCTADRKASEYNALRSSAVKMHGLFERFRNCVTASGGMATFADSLHSLSHSLASSAPEDENDGSAEFRTSIRVLAEKVGYLSRHRSELLDRCTKAESANGILVKELEDKKESIKSFFTKLQIEKQANKEKISFGRLEVHELAAFVLNSYGHYVAINRNSSNYYLSSESVALFVEQHPSRPTYIIGQVVHIERQVVKPLTYTSTDHANKMDLLSSDAGNRSSPRSAPVSSNPYNLHVGCEYFVVTVAMLPDTICSSASS